MIPSQTSYFTRTPQAKQARNMLAVAPPGTKTFNPWQPASPAPAAPSAPPAQQQSPAAQAPVSQQPAGGGYQQGYQPGQWSQENKNYPSYDSTESYWSAMQQQSPQLYGDYANADEYWDSRRAAAAPQPAQSAPTVTPPPTNFGFQLPDFSNMFGNSGGTTSTTQGTTTSNQLGFSLPAFRPLDTQKMNAATDAESERMLARLNRNTNESFGDSGFQTKGGGYGATMNENLARMIGQKERSRLENELAGAQAQNEFGPKFASSLADMLRIKNDASGQNLSFLAQLLSQMGQFATA